MPTLQWHKDMSAETAVYSASVLLRIVDDSSGESPNAWRAMVKVRPKGESYRWIGPLAASSRSEAIAICLREALAFEQSPAR